MPWGRYLCTSIVSTILVRGRRIQFALKLDVPVVRRSAKCCEYDNLPPKFESLEVRFFPPTRLVEVRHVLAVLARFDGIIPLPFDVGFSRNDEVKDPEGQNAVNRPESLASSCLEPQIGFQLAHEQFKVPELVELGIAADQAGFDLLAVSDHFQPWTALWSAIAFGRCLPRVAGERSWWAFSPVATAQPNWNKLALFASMQLPPTCWNTSKISAWAE